MKTPEEIRLIVEDALNSAFAEIQQNIDPENVSDSGMHCDLYFEHKGTEFRRMVRILESYATSLEITVQNIKDESKGTGSEAQDKANREWNEKARKENNPRS